MTDDGPVAQRLEQATHNRLVLGSIPGGATSSEEVEESVVAAIRSRRDAGRAKYGVTMEREDLNALDWLQHLQEELLDAAIYVEKLKRTVTRKG